MCFFLKGKFLPAGAEGRNRAVSDVEPSSLLIWPQNASGTGLGCGVRGGGEGRALVGAAWRVLRRPPGERWPAGGRGWYLRAGVPAVQVLGGTPRLRIRGPAAEAGQPRSWAEGAGGRAGSCSAGKEPPVATRDLRSLFPFGAAETFFSFSLEEQESRFGVEAAVCGSPGKSFWPQFTSEAASGAGSGEHS